MKTVTWVVVAYDPWGGEASRIPWSSQEECQEWVKEQEEKHPERKHVIQKVVTTEIKVYPPKEVPL